MKQHFWKIALVICLIAIAAIQGVWLVNTGKAYENSLRLQLGITLENAMEREIRVRITSTPRGGRMETPPIKQDAALPNCVYMSEVLDYYGYPLNISVLDSIVGELLQKAEISTESRISVLRGDTVLEESKENETFVSDTLCSYPFPVRADRTESVRITLKNPHVIIYGKLSVLLLITFALTALAAAGVAYQIRQRLRERQSLLKKDNFMIATSHDMQNPLAAMMLCTGALHDEAVRENPEDYEEYLSRIESNLQSLTRQMKRNLRLYRMEEGDRDTHKEAVYLPRLWQEVVKEYGECSGKEVTFHVHFETEVLWAQPDLLKHTLVNLLTNSLKYSHNAVEISISTESRGRRDILRFRDNGIGIPRRFHKYVFKKYVHAVQEEFQNTHTPKGYGIGLSLVYNIMRAHGGSISLQSREGQGTEFTLRFPHPKRSQFHS